MRKAILLALAFGIAIATQAQGTLNRVAVPFGSESQNGNWQEWTFSWQSTVLQWFSAGYLQQRWTEPVAITAIAFRLNEQPISRTDYAATVPRVEISLGWTHHDMSNFAVRWAGNNPFREAVVYASDQVILNSPGGAGPNAFGLRFEFEEPFFYDPRHANLLMQVRTIGGGGVFPGTTRQVDWHFPESANPAVASWFFPDAYPYAQGVPWPAGIVTEFTWATVPEPSIAQLAVLPLLFLLKRKNRSM